MPLFGHKGACDKQPTPAGCLLVGWCLSPFLPTLVCLSWLWVLVWYQWYARQDGPERLQLGRQAQRDSSTEVNPLTNKKCANSSLSLSFSFPLSPFVLTLTLSFVSAFIKYFYLFWTHVYVQMCSQKKKTLSSYQMCKHTASLPAMPFCSSACWGIRSVAF